MAPDTKDYSKDELEAPSWLNADFFTKVLRKCEHHTDIKVQDIKFMPATVKGDHFASVMFRATVNYEKQGVDKAISMIIKTIPELEGKKKDLLKESKLFETEISIYSEVIPKFEEILRATGDETRLGAPCLYSSLSPHKIIIFEDLVPQGYTVLRERDINMTEAKAAYQKLAKWHAISYKLALEDRAFFDKYRHGIMSSERTKESDFMKGGIVSCISLIESLPTLAHFKPHLEAIQTDLLQKCRESFNEYRNEPVPNANYVLCHGDFHIKNIMFKNNAENGQLNDLALLDFQLSYMGPMVNDLMYSFFMLLSAEQRANHWDELQHYYFDNFLDVLQKIGFEGHLPTLENFKEQWMQHRHFEIFLLTTFLPMWYIFKTGDFEIEQMFRNIEYRREKMYENEKYVSELHTLLPRYLQLGYFEV